MEQKTEASQAVDELLTCPFCGAAAQIDEHPAHSHTGPLAGFIPDYPGSFTVECTGAGCNTGQIADTRADAVAMWNRRAQVEALTVPQWISVKPALHIAKKLARDEVEYLVATAPPARSPAFIARLKKAQDELSVIVSALHEIGAAPTIPAIPGTKEGA